MGVPRRLVDMTAGGWLILLEANAAWLGDQRL